MNILEMLGISNETTVAKTPENRKRKTKSSKKTSITTPSLFDFFDFDIFNLKDAVVIDEKQVYEPKEKKKISLNPMNLLGSLGKLIFKKNYTYSKAPAPLSVRDAIKNNINIIQILNKLKMESRLASKSEQTKLSRFVGWGTVAELFSSKKYVAEYQQLQNLVTPEELEKIKTSSLTSYYTPYNIATWVWKILTRMGFCGGNILDPSAGTGLFEMTADKELLEDSMMTLIEMDIITGTILENLMQTATVYKKPYQDVRLRENSFDLAISNIPFGDVMVYDSESKETRTIHNFFFAKTAKAVREGGIIAFITSRYFLDAKDSKLRTKLAENYNLVTAFRFSNKTFSESNTEVVSDLVILQKTSTPTRSDDWVKTVPYMGNHTINQYFKENPHHVIGTFKEVSGPFGPTLTVMPYTKEEEKEAIRELGFKTSSTDYMAQKDARLIRTTIMDALLDTIPEEIYTPAEDSSYAYEDYIELDEHFSSIKDGSYFIENGKVYIREGNKLIPYRYQYLDRISAYLNLKKEVDWLLSVQAGDLHASLDDEIERLNAAYDEFVSQYGFVNSLDNQKVLQDDSDYIMVSAIEDETEDSLVFAKGKIFSERIITPRQIRTSAENIEDAYNLSLSQYAKVNLEYMANLLNSDVESVKESLLEKNLAFKTEDGLIPPHEFLSGNIREKIKKYPEGSKNYNALLEVMPKNVVPTVEFGAFWVPADIILEFAKHLISFGCTENKNPFFYGHASGKWKLENIGKHSSRTYAVSGRSTLDVFLATLNSETIKITVKVDDKYVVDQENTALAERYQEEIRQKWGLWLESNLEARSTLTKIYNEIFNSYHNAPYSGEYLEFPGMSTVFSLRKYQKDAIAKIILGKNQTLLAHAVGAGKSATAICSVMELKRLGLVKKPLMITPNSLIVSGSMAREVKKLYPNAKVLVARTEDLKKVKRRKFLTKVMMQDWDLILMAHSTFKLIPMSAEVQMEYYGELLKEIEAVILEAEAAGQKFRDIEKKKESILAKKQALMDMRKDDFLTFEKLGIDYLVVDEAHAYKNLMINTSKTVAGIPTSHSQRAEDMFLKTSYLQKKYGKAVLFLTGTPVTNTIGELYNMNRFLHSEGLTQRGIRTFDAWASAFGKEITELELDPTGKSFRLKTRFSKFNNVPELVTSFKEFADIVTSEHLKTEANLPELKNGKPFIHTLEMTDAMRDFRDDLVERVNRIQSGAVDPSEDNMLKITSDGRKLSIAPQLVGIEAKYRHEMPKISKVVDVVYKEYLASNDVLGTQLIFCDLGVPNGKGFNVYETLKNLLVEEGISAQEIAFMQEFSKPEQKEQLIDDFNSGKIRILIGSTGTMGEGLNVQEKLVALHHMDTVWVPAALTQREGRIIRHGNTNSSVSIHTYVVKGTFDGYMWQLLARKNKAIDALYNYQEGDERSIEDISQSTLTYDEIKKESIENPLLKRKIEKVIDLTKAKALQSAHLQKRGMMESNLASLTESLPEMHERLENLKRTKPFVDTSETFSHITINGLSYTDKYMAAERLKAIAERYQAGSNELYIADYRNFEIIAVKYYGFDVKSLTLRHKDTGLKLFCEYSGNVKGMFLRIDNTINSIEKADQELEARIKRYENDVIEYKKQLETSISYLPEIFALEREIANLDEQIAKNGLISM